MCLPYVGCNYSAGTEKTPNNLLKRISQHFPNTHKQSLKSSNSFKISRLKKYIEKKEGREVVRVQLSSSKPGDIRTALTQESIGTVLGGLHRDYGTSSNVAPSGTVYYGNMSELLRPLFVAHPCITLKHEYVGACFRMIASAGGRCEELIREYFMDESKEYDDSFFPVAEPTDVRVRDLYLVLCKMGYEQGFGHPARMHGLFGHLIQGCKFYTVSVRDGAFEWVRVPGLFFGCLHISEAFGLNYEAVRKCVREAEAENDWEANHAAILAIDDGTMLGLSTAQILIEERPVLSYGSLECSDYELDETELRIKSEEISKKNASGECDSGEDSDESNEEISLVVAVEDERINVTGKNWKKNTGPIASRGLVTNVPGTDRPISPGPAPIVVMHKLKGKRDFTGFATGNLLMMGGNKGLNIPKFKKLRKDRDGMMEAIIKRNS